ncbi:MAG: dienelactone hydrolase family protein [Nitrosopumilus sp.]|nr:dienelactone hydrolase family protein [Nitrosopumilus sp.]MDH3394624.1 dienelactone hydrolase family protein [Nitrosopumilus sp.]
MENHIRIYDNIDHAFANPSGDLYAPEESGDAWAQTSPF